MRVVDAADPDGGVGQVDDGVAGGVQAGQCGADGDGLAGADLAGDHADAAFADAPGDAGDGLVVGGVAVQHARGQVAAERHAGEPVVGLQFSIIGVLDLLAAVRAGQAGAGIVVAGRAGERRRS